jgi:hypothetical protein
MANGKHHAYIIEIEGKFLVRPSVATIGKNEELTIRNLTSYPARVENCSLFAAQRTDVSPGSVGTISLASPSGVDQYEVWLQIRTNAWVRVHGDSDPVIIIDP